MPSKRRKPVYAWAIVTPRGRLDTDSIRLRRREAIHEYCAYYCGRGSWWWVTLRADGYRCVKVEIREVGK